MTIKRILVGVDGSSYSRAALEWAASLASATGAEVVAVHAVGLLEQLEGDAPVPAQSHRDEIRHLFERQWCAPLDAAGVRSRRVLRDGPPVLALRAAADEVDADLVVVG
ncbi:MAG TPA: universal stress protein, partial [Acidimicrobiales bacterium]|nr:universal stress protein [Acidimicrobiales bacterium]